MAIEILDGPKVEERPEQPTLGIRTTVPFRTMLAERDRLLGELLRWLAATGVETEGPFFLRLWTVDMAGDMDIEVGVVADHPGDERVRAGAMPAGRYAALSYRAASLEANRALLRWAGEQGLDFDESDGRWAGRFELWLTDPRAEKRKKQWIVELAFLLRS